MKKILNRYTLYNLIIIAMLAAIGIAAKVVVGVPIRTLTSAIGIPGGAIVGGFYMLWIVLSIGIVKIPGTGTLFATIQALVIFTTGAPGSHGFMTFLTYILPGVGADLVFLVSKNKKYNSLHYVLGTIVANIIGTIGSNFLFFKMPVAPLLISIASATLSGLIGGLIAYGVILGLNKLGFIEKIRPTKKDIEDAFCDQILDNPEKKSETKDVKNENLNNENTKKDFLNTDNKSFENEEK